MDNICFLPAKSIAELIYNGQVSSQDVVEAHFERVGGWIKPGL